ncbi:uncharacterized protein LOC141661189 [Apium graveolens]|uniref:uncharacterized protein LOC141661189 n=1 Tax=Apium graveolens TaxID=4045 RepID=UPI003D7939F9
MEKLKGLVGLSYPVLTMGNYTAWSMKIRVIMQAHGVWEAIENNDPKAAVERKTDRIALAMIYQGIPEDYLLSIAEKLTAKDAWEAIKTMSQALGETVAESYVVKKLLRDVPPKFFQIVSTLEQFGNLDAMSIEEAIGALKAHEERLKGSVTTNDVQLMLTEEEWRKRDYKGEKLPLTREEWMKRSNKGISTGTPGQKGRGTRDKSQVRCFNCGISGHYTAECRKPRQAREFKQEVNIAKVEDDEPALFLAKFERNEKNQAVLNKAEVTTNQEVVGKSNTWYLDNGPSNHMTGDKSKFNVFNEEVSGNAMELMLKNKMVKGMPDVIQPKKLFFLLVDDYTRLMWVYMLKNKSDAFEVLKKFQVKVEKEKREKIGTFRTDRGGEFMSKEFISYCDNQGINRYFTAPYTPQQNDVVERRNRTVVEMGRSFLKQMKMPSVMWTEAIRHVVYVLNRLPTRALSGQTSHEVWKGCKPDIQHIRVFGCVVHMKVPSDKVKKLDDRSLMVVNLGKEPGTKAYRMFDPKEKKLYVSRDMVFEEERA